MIYCEDCSSYECGCPERKEIESLHRQLAAKQAEVDALMLEYCPSEMSQEQLNNWAAHQRPAERDEQAEVFRVEVESLRQHLIGSNTLIQTYREATTSLRQQVTLLRDELFAVLVQDMSRDSAIAKIEALDATADLDGLILCEKEPAAWKTVEMLYPPITEEQRRSSDVPLYRAWGPKP